jgi:hypothetical protein
MCTFDPAQREKRVWLGWYGILLLAERDYLKNYFNNTIFIFYCAPTELWISAHIIPSPAPNKKHSAWTGLVRHFAPMELDFI